MADQNSSNCLTLVIFPHLPYRASAFYSEKPVISQALMLITTGAITVDIRLILNEKLGSNTIDWRSIDGYLYCSE